MKARLWNSLEQAIPWATRGKFQSLSRFECTSSFSTTSSTRAPPATAKDAMRQKENDLLRPSQTTTSNSAVQSEGLNGVLSIMNSRYQNAGQRGASYIDGLRKRQEQHFTAYGNRTPPHNLHIYAHKHNTLITLTRPNGDPLMSLGCGNIGFRKSHRGGYDPAFQLSSHVLAQIQEKGFLHDISGITLVFRGFGHGREAFTKVLLGNEGRNVRPLVTRVTDATRLKFGGTRSRNVRRLG
ncbi:hypothetical protein BGW36DRAFT_386187 [Talaromyces proteolyticus]|uniref:Glutamine amidotransferase type-2 domain-containing protein n=1 Tax=Talaromyces proteolyticus TaxID=1131652 RepID=A0AAD4PXX6_9EURO|nr:uncharacterized protein BGW36DRAFT_386187 [Talaromyces proteolyticus]KAH8693243.1 hypothetical protein BGW36DRAFT_386187 [Talaromyces proteolyticus]